MARRPQPSTGVYASPGRVAVTVAVKAGRRYGPRVVRKPPNFEWLGFTAEQRQLLDFLDQVGNNGWARVSQTESVMPHLLGRFDQVGLTVERVKEAMATIGYAKDALHQLDRWESKRTTGKFGK